ncbi:MAG TPA: hypothetical protein VFS32_08220, partial [Candidatus Limnocylindrales bacterium]|nr:hypothetical protein [Candidatus Limnocylindrales bacterium]
RALLAASLRRVREAGAACAALGVDTGNENRALDLYESLGFRIVAEFLELHRSLSMTKGGDLAAVAAAGHEGGLR